MAQNNTAPVVLRINNIDYPLNDVNEKRLKQRLYKKYSLDTLVEEWVDGNLINTLELRDIFSV